MLRRLLIGLILGVIVGGLAAAAAFLERGLLLRPLGNVVYFMPPYCITESETAWALEEIVAVLKSTG